MENAIPRESENVDAICDPIEESYLNLSSHVEKSQYPVVSVEVPISRIRESPVPYERLSEPVESSLAPFELTTVEPLLTPFETSTGTFLESVESSSVPVEISTELFDQLPSKIEPTPTTIEPSPLSIESTSIKPSPDEPSPASNSGRRGFAQVYRSLSWRDDKRKEFLVLPYGDATATATTIFAQNLLQFSLPVPAIANIKPPVPSPAPAPIFVEPPPSSDDNEDDPELRVVIDSKFLNGSSSNLLAKSAPSTPQGERLQAGTAFPATTQTTPAPGPPPKSPSHVFNRHDKQALKQLSVSAPVMTQAQAAARPQPASDPLVTTAGPPSPEQQPGSSKSRQKKFHRHFKQVAAEELVLNYYSCALVGDILLQGHLYITKNYFAFYSNVFGYVTKLLIPTVSVLKISKEKTARIIPNAVGVATEDDKHVFCSLLSRDTTYRLMVQVWKTAMSPGPPNPLPITKEIKDEVDSASGDIHPNEEDDDSSSVSGSERSCPPTPLDSHTDVSHSESCPSKLPNGNVGVREKSIPFSRGNTIVSMLPRPTLILIVSTGLLVLLFLSAAFLLYRIGRIHNQFAENPLLTGSDEVYQEILKWQTQLHSKSANEVQEFLNTNLDQLAKVRQSLEALSLLIVTDENNKSKSPATSNSHHHQQAAAPLPREKHS